GVGWSGGSLDGSTAGAIIADPGGAGFTGAGTTAAGGVWTGVTATGFAAGVTGGGETRGGTGIATGWIDGDAAVGGTGMIGCTAEAFSVVAWTAGTGAGVTVPPPPLAPSAAASAWLFATLIWTRTWAVSSFVMPSNRAAPGVSSM